MLNRNICPCWFLLFFIASELVPSLCVTASITPSISPVVSGSTVTLTCLVYSDIGLLKTNVTIVHEMTNGTIRKLQPQRESTPNLFQYISLLHNVTSEEDKGKYICVAVIKEFNIEVNDSITLKISETSHGSIFTTLHPKSPTPLYLAPSSLSVSSASTRYSTQVMMETVMRPYTIHTSTSYHLTSFHTFSLSVSSSSLTTSPTQVLQSEDSNDITLILVTIVVGFILLIVVVLIIIIFILLVGMTVLGSSKRTYEANHNMKMTNIIITK